MKQDDFTVIRADGITVAMGYKCPKCGLINVGTICITCGKEKDIKGVERCQFKIAIDMVTRFVKCAFLTMIAYLTTKKNVRIGKRRQ